ncbi:hypothetical protein [Microbacterium sp. XT11]|uniref:hypothetical protein n=1 Tax=Microbacterium sp. XT11 TaxID=367477 RepID=UPI00082BEF4A|nr:hypothetical protein [Microbacterium sp. XT11]
MTKGIDLAIAADTRAAMSAINRGIIDPLEDVSDLLDKVGDESQDAGRDLERSMRDAQRRTDDAADEIKRLRDELNKAGRAGKDSGDDVHRGMRRAADAANEASDELRQNLGETFSSFRGDLEDLPQIAQDVFGGLAGSVDSLTGSIGLAAGAAGIGLLIAAIQTAGEEQQKVKDRAADWANAYIEAGGRVLDFDTKMAGIKQVLTEQYDEAKKNAELWGVSVQTAAAAMSGSEEAINRAQAGINKMKDGADELAASGATVTDQFGNITLAGNDLAGTAVAGQAALDGYKRSLEIATAQADAYSIALIDTARSTAGATEAVDEFGDTVISLPDGRQIYIDAETGQATDDVNAIQQKIYGVQGKTVNITARTTVDTSEYDRVVRRISGTTLKIGTRVVTSGWDQ